MGSEFFNQVQYGVEVTKGTPVAATQMFIGQMPAIKSDRKAVQPVEHFGVRAESFRSVIHQYLYNNTLSVEHGAYQHLPMLFSSIKGAVTAVEQTTDQDDYLWDFTPSLLAANSPDAFTLRFGDDAQAYVSEYCMFERIRISGQVAQGMDASPVKLEADFFGRQIATTTFTPSLSPRTLTPLNSKLARLYLNSTWGVSQVETATIAGTVTGAGNATVTVTAAGMTGSPKAISVAVANLDTAAQAAGKMRTALNNDAAVTALFTVGGTGVYVTLTRKIQAANDTTLNIAFTNDTCTGLTPGATSADTTAGVLGVGGTELDGVLRSFDIEIITGVHPRFAGSALQTFDSHGEGIIGVMGTFGIEGGADAAAVFASQMANGLAVIRLDVNGGQIGSGEDYLLRVDFGGSYEDATPISGADRGDNLASFVVKDYYEKTSGKKLQVSCITNHATY